MICSRAGTVLDALAQGHLRALPAELEELCQAGLIHRIDTQAIAHLGALESMAASRGKLGDAPLEVLLRPGWLQSALLKLEASLKSEIHRSTTANAVLLEEEKARADMRALMGLLVDGRATAAMREASEVRRSLEQTLVVPAPPTQPGQPPEHYAVSPLGRRMVQAIGVRMARCAQEPLPSFMKRFRKAEAQMATMGQAAQRLESGVGTVVKGKTQVVMGLMKSGLPVENALRAYAQSAPMATWVPPKERPHMAVAYVRGAARSGSLQAEATRLNEAMDLVRRQMLAGGDQIKMLARSLVAFPQPAEGLPRLRALLEALRAQGVTGEDRSRAAARFMSAAGEPAELAARLKQVGNLLARTPVGSHPKRVALTLALAAAITQPGAEHAAVARYLSVAQALATAKLPRGCDAYELAIDLTPLPGEPAELIHVLGQASLHFSGGAQPSAQHVQLAAAFAKRFIFLPPAHNGPR
jgi:hypothetical protein